ncbi:MULTISPECIES: hypothetical protein [unclassified Clostridium]|nr:MULTISPECIES: hypothetical protein [unclassified Clostridium]EKQ50149.1 MAG: hypothetical protein A370_05910 [Clostridium sp. Maddingley MBC34-26]
MKNKPYDKRKSINSLGSDLTTAIQNLHVSGEMVENTNGEKTKNSKS